MVMQTTAGDYLLDNPTLRQFIEAVNAIRQRHVDPAVVLAQVRPHFVRLLAEDGWLPEQFQQLAEGSGMGGSIGTWLLYRAEDGGLAFSSLVVPPGVQTPVHDHLAWGLVGLYRGEQDEEVFARQDDGSRDGYAELRLAERRSLRPCDLYELLPENDIHRVRATSDTTSVSLHMLGNDNGCIWRHRFDPDKARVEPFRSGYVNVDCPSP